MGQAFLRLQVQHLKLRNGLRRLLKQSGSDFVESTIDDQDNQARIIVQRLLRETHVTQNDFAVLTGLCTANFNQWLNHPGEHPLDGRHVIHFLLQLLAEIAFENLTVELQRENDQDKDDEGGASATAIMPGEVTPANDNEQNINGLTMEMSYLNAMYEKAFAVVADPIGIEPK
jgi:hypothetical protein